MREITVPSDVIGLIIGRRGENIRNIQTLTKTNIQIEQIPPGTIVAERKIIITSRTEANANKARLMLLDIANNAPSLTTGGFHGNRNLSNSLVYQQGTALMNGIPNPNIVGDYSMTYTMNTNRPMVNVNTVQSNQHHYFSRNQQLVVNGPQSGTTTAPPPPQIVSTTMIASPNTNTQNSQIPPPSNIQQNAYNPTAMYAYHNPVNASSNSSLQMSGGYGAQQGTSGNTTTVNNGIPPNWNQPSGAQSMITVQQTPHSHAMSMNTSTIQPTYPTYPSGWNQLLQQQS